MGNGSAFGPTTVRIPPDESRIQPDFQRIRPDPQGHERAAKPQTYMHFHAKALGSNPLNRFLIQTINPKRACGKNSSWPVGKAKAF